MKLLFLIIFSPIWLMCMVTYVILIGLMGIFGRIPIIGTPIFLILLLLCAPFYPVLLIYGLNRLQRKKQTIDFREDGFILKERNKEGHFAWEAILALKKDFDPPFFIDSLHTNSGEIIKLNPFTETEILRQELEKHGIWVEETQGSDENR